MKKNTIIFCLIIFIITITSFIVFSINENYKYDNKNIIESNITNDTNKSSMISYMLPGTNPGEYIQTTTNAWPSTDTYEFNPALSKCENGSKITWNTSTNKAEVLINGTDNCYLYFYKISYWNAGFAGGYYSYPNTPTTTYPTLAQLQSNYAEFSTNPIYIKTTDKHETCLNYNNHEFCLGANYWVGDSQDQIDGTTTKNKIQTAMEAALGTSATRCDSYSESAGCSFGTVMCYALSVGLVFCANNNVTCSIDSSGTSLCYES